MSSEKAYNYAEKNGGSDDLRNLCCQDPYYALLYALWVDRYPREETRKAACEYPFYAYSYALELDECSRDDTRTAACKSPEYAYYYAVDIDKGYHRETRRSCYKYYYSYNLYLKDVLESKYYEEIKLLQEIKRVNHAT